MRTIVRFFAKNCDNFFWYTIFQITYTVGRDSILTCIITMVPTLGIFLIFILICIFIFKAFSINMINFTFSYDSYCSLVNNFVFFFLKSIILIACSLKNSQNLFLQCLPLHTSCLFSMSLSGSIVEKGLCLL